MPLAVYFIGFVAIISPVFLQKIPTANNFTELPATSILFNVTNQHSNETETKITTAPNPNNTVSDTYNSSNSVSIDNTTKTNFPSSTISEINNTTKTPKVTNQLTASVTQNETTSTTPKSAINSSAAINHTSDLKLTSTISLPESTVAPNVSKSTITTEKIAVTTDNKKSETSTVISSTATKEISNSSGKNYCVNLYKIMFFLLCFYVILL